jgi:23S rRNA (adenine2030-N6)-methyltransferase
MNYRHAYHAGNFADVVKHVLLTLILVHLRKKEAPFCVIDTHAGAGRYDLAGPEAGRTGEFHDGIGRLLAAGHLPSQLDDYVAAVRAVNRRWPVLDSYPGSPRIARFLLRSADRLALVELHPDDAAALRRDFAGDRQVGVHHADAYVALKALLPPRERRGLVLIDPPFEVEGEFRRVCKGLHEALRRWPSGIYAVWYPIKTRPLVDRFLDEAATWGPPCLAAEMHRTPLDRPDRLNGCGLVVLNPPWQLDAALAEVLPVLAEVLDAQRGTDLRWLATENR